MKIAYAFGYLGGIVLLYVCGFSIYDNYTREAKASVLHQLQSGKGPLSSNASG